jgi:hypothetical protein
VLPAYADADSVQKVCIITTSGAKGEWSFIPVPKWASGDLCDAIRKALPTGRERDTKLGCMVGPNEADFRANTFHIVGANLGNPCHWPFVVN